MLGPADSHCVPVNASACYSDLLSAQMCVLLLLLLLLHLRDPRFLKGLLAFSLHDHVLALLPVTVLQ